MANRKKSNSTRNNIINLFPSESVRFPDNYIGKRISNADFRVVAQCAQTGLSWSDLLAAAKESGASIGWGKLHKIAAWMYQSPNKAKFQSTIEYIAGLFLQMQANTTKANYARFRDECVAMAQGSFVIPEAEAKATKSKTVSARTTTIDFAALVAARNGTSTDADGDNGDADKGNDTDTETETETETETGSDAPVNAGPSEQSVTATTQRTHEQTMELIDQVSKLKTAKLQERMMDALGL